MKKAIIISLSIIAVLAIVFGILLLLNNYGNKITLSQNGELFINTDANPITANVTVNTRKNGLVSFDLPFIEVLNRLDAKVDWIDDNRAKITYIDRDFILNLSEATLVEVGKDHNLFTRAPGSAGTYKPLEKEVILDDAIIKSTLRNMDIYVMIYGGDNPPKATLFVTTGTRLEGNIILT